MRHETRGNLGIAAPGPSVPGLAQRFRIAAFFTLGAVHCQSHDTHQLTIARVSKSTCGDER